MRVLLISHTCQSQTEGQPKALELAARLDGELAVLVPERWKHYGKWRGAEIRADANYRYLVEKAAWPWSGPGQFYLHWYPRLASLLKKFQPDVIDIWEEPWSLVSAQVCWLRNLILPQARIIFETEQNLHRAYPPPFGNFRSYTLRHADFSVCRSAEALQVIRSQGYQGEAEVVPNAVDHRLFHPQDREDCKTALGLHGFVIGYVGRLVERKGLMDLVNALPWSPPHVTLLFAGAGDYATPLHQRIHELGLASRVRFLPERPLETLPLLMNAIDALALPSWTVPSWKEQFGRVIIEAHACSTPVIGSCSGAIPDVIGEGGIVFPERNPAAIAAAITELCENPARCRTLGESGRRQVLEKYTWGAVAEQMHGIYRAVGRNPRIHLKEEDPHGIAKPG